MSVVYVVTFSIQGAQERPAAWVDVGVCMRGLYGFVVAVGEALEARDCHTEGAVRLVLGRSLRMVVELGAHHTASG